jgi:hypothetical protein
MAPGTGELEWLFHPGSVAVIGSGRTRSDIQDIPHSFFFALFLRNMNSQGSIYLVSKSGASHPRDPEGLRNERGQVCDDLFLGLR